MGVNLLGPGGHFYGSRLRVSPGLRGGGGGEEGLRGIRVNGLHACAMLHFNLGIKKTKTNKSSREKYFFNAFCALQILGRILPSADKRKKLKWQQTIPPNETCHQRVTCRKLNAESDMEVSLRCDYTEKVWQPHTAPANTQQPQPPHTHTHSLHHWSESTHCSHMLLVPGSPPLASLSFPSTGSPAGRPEEKPGECLPRQSESTDQQSQSGQNQGSNPGLQKTTMFRTASVTEASGPDCEQLPHNKMNCRVQ